MSTQTRSNLVALIEELRRSAARNRALALESHLDRPWRRHDVRIYMERELDDLRAIMILEGELAT